MSRGGPAWAEAVHTRSNEIVDALRLVGEAELRQPSALPEWSRLTVACHLRYGAEALCRMTEEGLAGRPTAYYPMGRSVGREASLRLRDGESGRDVVSALGDQCEALSAQWSALSPDAWGTVLSEPEGNADIGPLPLDRLALLRLSEVEVHGGDLDMGLGPWSEVFVRDSLPFRLEWLNSRRANHVAFDGDVSGSWLLQASDGPTYAVSVHAGEVTSRPASRGEGADAVISGSSRDLMALLLGRPFANPLGYAGDVELGHAFSLAFPGP